MLCRLPTASGTTAGFAATRSRLGATTLMPALANRNSFSKRAFRVGESDDSDLDVRPDLMARVVRRGIIKHPEAKMRRRHEAGRYRHPSTAPNAPIPDAWVRHCSRTNGGPWIAPLPDHHRCCPARRRGPSARRQGAGTPAFGRLSRLQSLDGQAEPNRGIGRNRRRVVFARKMASHLLVRPDQ